MIFFTEIEKINPKINMETQRPQIAKQFWEKSAKIEVSQLPTSDYTTEPYQ
jgi:hypothetical protein